MMGEGLQIKSLYSLGIIINLNGMILLFWDSVTEGGKSITSLAVDWSASRRLLREERSQGDPAGASRGGFRPARGKRRLARKSIAVYGPP